MMTLLELVAVIRTRKGPRSWMLSADGAAKLIATIAAPPRARRVSRKRRGRKAAKK